MCVRRAEDGQPYSQCSRCGTKEMGGSMDEATFWAYVREKRGWRRVQQGCVWLWLCKECYQDTPAW